jgi:hypothetical protein
LSSFSQKAWMVWIFSPPGAGLGQEGGVPAIAALALQPRQLEAQVGVLQDRPLAQGVEQAALHLGGGGLGVGDAQDGLGRGVGQQQPRHPGDKGGGLARAGVGGDEHRLAGRRGADLRVWA